MPFHCDTDCIHARSCLRLSQTVRVITERARHSLDDQQNRCRLCRKRRVQRLVGIRRRDCVLIAFVRGADRRLV